MLMHTEPLALGKDKHAKIPYGLCAWTMDGSPVFIIFYAQLLM